VVDISPNDGTITGMMGVQQQEEWQMERRRFFSEATMTKIPVPEEALELTDGECAEQSSAAIR